ncbi:MAG TPA: plasmid partition protein ParG [Pirellulales bacterium]|nr:plasmid partition protein ParG [Pirellulales bacterium]
MSGKKVTFASKRPSQAVSITNIDKWVENRDVEVPEAPPPEPMKRLTIDVSVSLHKRIKSQCAMQNLRMADVIRDLLDEHFGSGTKLGEGA